jgi:catechol 2,3-dioxygenase-like lactoylglutathione lyase family enzyme
MASLKILDLSHIALNVTDIERSASFYKNILGLESIFENELPDGIGFNIGFITPAGVTIELIQISGMKIQAKEYTTTIAFSVESLDSAKAALSSDSIEIKNEMEFYGVKMFFINDPDGHNIEISQFPDGVSCSAKMH